MNAATVFERAQDGDEAYIEAAFKAVEITAKFYSTSVAHAIAERWLWGTGWKMVAYQLGCTRQTAFERCLSGFAWIDRNIVFTDTGEEMTVEYVR